MDNRATPDEYEQGFDQEEQSSTLLPKLLIAPIAILIATMMIGLPVLRILTVNGDDTAVRREAASDVRGQVAALFSSAVLESRSPTIAARYAVEDVHEQMSAVIVDLQRRDPAELQDAVASTARVDCTTAGPDQECFTSRLARDGQEPVVEISFVVGIINGAARVVAIERFTTTVLLRGYRRDG